MFVDSLAECISALQQERAIFKFRLAMYLKVCLFYNQRLVMACLFQNHRFVMGIMADLLHIHRFLMSNGMPTYAHRLIMVITRANFTLIGL